MACMIPIRQRQQTGFFFLDQEELASNSCKAGPTRNEIGYSGGVVVGRSNTGAQHRVGAGAKVRTRPVQPADYI